MAKGKGGFIGQDGLNAPDSPTGVSGTAGDTQVTVSFTAPSDVGGSAITGYSVQSDNGDGSASSIALASYNNKNFSIASQETTLMAFFIDDSGTRLFAVGYTNDTVYQYTLSTAWDISSASYDSKSFSVASQMTIPRALSFSSDGTKMYVGEYTTIYEYNLSTAWDVSTASYNSVSFSPSSQTSTLHEIVLSPDGTKMYITALSEDSIFQYSLSTAYDLSTASYASKSLSTSSQDSTPYGLAFNPDGTKAYVSGGSTYTVYQYNLTTAYDISTGAYSDSSFDASGQGANNQFCLVFKSDGTKMYLGGFNTDIIYEYLVPEYPTASPVTVTGLTNGTSYTFNVWAINAFGYSAPSDASGSVSPIAAAIGLFGGAAYGFLSAINVIQEININSEGNATDFGDLTVARDGNNALSSSTRAVFAAGYTGSAWSDVMDYVTIASSGNATDFGNLLTTNVYLAGSANNTRGIWAGGSEATTNTRYNVIQYITIASTGNATDFGDLTVARRQGNGLASSTRSISFAGGQPASGSSNVMDYVTIATTGNASDFGDLSAARQGVGAASSSTRGLFAGGQGYNNIEYVTIASVGNTTDFGDLTQSVLTSGTSSTIRAVFAHQTNNTIEYVTISTLGNGADFGDSITSNGGAGCSAAHGGLS